MAVTVQLKGKIFSPNAPRAVKKAIRAGIGELVLEGEGMVKAQLYPGHGVITANLRRAVAGHVRDDLNGQIDAGEIAQGRDVNYAGWIEGISPRNTRSRFKGYRMFRNVRDRFAKQDLSRFFAKRVRKALGG